MKIRKGFVSNSSSSSFVCDVCGEQVSGWDMCLSEADMFECENGHTVCWDHSAIGKQDAQKIYAKKMFDEILAKKEEDLYAGEKVVLAKGFELAFEDGEGYLTEEFDCCVPKEACPICSMTIISKSDYVDLLMAKTKIPKSGVLVEIKKTNARRRKVYDNDYIEYACAKLRVVPNEYEKELLNKFNSYDEFKKAILIGDGI
jgi:hypothetical protein